MNNNRRNFLRQLGVVGAGAALAKFGLFSQMAHASDYKALVCVFLGGGNDGNNTIIPNTTTGYANYASIRGALAIAQNTLVPLTDTTGATNYGLHPALSPLGPVWNGGRLAVLLNAGTLVQPLTQAQYHSVSNPKPLNLFSHLDQQRQWQSGISSAQSQTGWGGRIADVMASLNTASSIPAVISTAGNFLYVTGANTQPLSISANAGLTYHGFTNSDGLTRNTALTELLSVDNQNDMVAAAEGITLDTIKSASIVNPILKSTSSNIAAAFSGLTTGIAAQFEAVAKFIEAQTTIGASRQIFLVNIGSFDTHTNQLNTQGNLLTQLGAAMAAFDTAMTSIGAANNVTTFTLSDFSRTFKPNINNGSDHAWGNHHLIMGGAVKGQTFYGTMPELTLGGPDDAGVDGRWIPTTSVDQYAATLASWFGVSATDLTTVLPNLSAFSVKNLGFI